MCRGGDPSVDGVWEWNVEVEMFLFFFHFSIPADGTACTRARQRLSKRMKVTYRGELRTSPAPACYRHLSRGRTGGGRGVSQPTIPRGYGEIEAA